MNTEPISVSTTKIAMVASTASLAQATEAGPMLILGLSLGDWAAGLTAIYVIFQGIVIFPEVVKTIKRQIERFRTWRKGR